MKKNMLALLFVTFVSFCLADAKPYLIRWTDTRRAFVRGEKTTFHIQIQNLTAESMPPANLVITAESLINCTIDVNDIAAQGECVRGIYFDTSIFKEGQYILKCQLFHDGKELTTESFPYAIARQWNPERMNIWLWPHRKFGVSVFRLNETAKTQLAWYADKGINSFCPGGGVGFERQDIGPMLELYDYMLCRGWEAGFEVSRGIFDDVNDPCVVYEPKRPLQFTKVKMLCDPFHPKVAQYQNQTNRKLMESLSQYPGLGVCYFESEYEDFLPPETPLAKHYASCDVDTLAPHRFIMPGVIADTDEGYVRHLCSLKSGDGLTAGNRRAAEMVHRYRPDIMVFTDPFRSYAIYDRFAGLDAVSSWSYVNPDLKYMLYVETLIAAAKPANQKVVPIVTLLNYPGTIFPKDKGWPLMGPDELVETLWINLSRRPDMLGVYLSSEGDPFDAPVRQGVEKTWEEGPREPYQRYPKTFEALKQFSRAVIQPYGPMIKKLSRLPRKAAVLSSESSRLYSASPVLLGYYPNYQVYCFYTLLNMIHVPADIIFDETISEFGLGGYDVLILAKCDTLTESVYKRIVDFQRRGGRVVADQYLRAPLKEVVRFDFDFTYRDKVSADAIISNTTYAHWDDHIDVKNATMKDVNGVTALDDQRIMEDYALQLRNGLEGKVVRRVDCSSPTALLNELENDGVVYLMAVNDNRAYGKRIGEYKAMLEKAVPQTLNIHLNEWPEKRPVIYDLLEKKELNYTGLKAPFIVDVDLPAPGGKMIMICRQRLAGIDVDIPSKIKRGQKCGIDVYVRDTNGMLMRGAIPLHISVTDAGGNDSEYSDYYAAQSGHLSLTMMPAMNDKTGPWEVKVQELITRKTKSAAFQVVK